MSTQKLAISPRVIVQLLVFIAFVPFLPLLISRHWDWWEAWVYAAISILGFVISRVLAARRNPDLLVERSRLMQHEDALPWDKLLVPIIGLAGVLIMLVVGLDELLGWSAAFSLPVKMASLAILLAGHILSSYALIENRFFSGMVRLQTDRGHQLVSGGPYRWMRHPGYAGAILIYLATPLFLDSSWAFLPAVLLCIVLFIRTYLEDGFLQGALVGYRDYTGRVHYRLLPGIW